MRIFCPPQRIRRGENNVCIIWVKSPFGATSLGFSSKTRINREDFGITWNMEMEGGVAVGRNVEIILDVEADLVAE